MALLGRLVFRSVKHRELGRCQGAEAAVWSQVIVILTPSGEDRVPASPNQNFETPAAWNWPLLTGTIPFMPPPQTDSPTQWAPAV